MIDGFYFVHLLAAAEPGGLPAARDGANRVDPRDLNDLDRHMLKEAFRQARKLQNMLSSITSCDDGPAAHGAPGAADVGGPLELRPRLVDFDRIHEPAVTVADLARLDAVDGFCEMCASAAVLSWQLPQCAWPAPMKVSVLVQSASPASVSGATTPPVALSVPHTALASAPAASLQVKVTERVGSTFASGRP